MCSNYIPSQNKVLRSIGIVQFHPYAFQVIPMLTFVLN